jgi:hypothetical protein
MKRVYKKSTIASVFLLLFSVTSYGSTVEQKALEVEALSIVKQFASTLKPQLKAAMKNGGPINAINVCSLQAPAIAKSLSAQSNWTVKRVSLKARNEKTALPDAWESKMLQQFEQQKNQGIAVNKLTASDISNGEFRYMKAQGIGPVCLHCHGENIKADVQSALNQHYPNDKATGYRLGDVRGAFSLRKKL